MAQITGEPADDGSLNDPTDSAAPSSTERATSGVGGALDPTDVPAANLCPDPSEIGDAVVLPFPTEDNVSSSPVAAGSPVAPASPVDLDSPVDLTGAPGPDLAAQLMSLNPRLCNGSQILDGIAAFERLISWATAHQQSWMTAAGVPGAVVDQGDAIAMVEARESIDFDLVQETEPEMAQQLLEEQTIYLAAMEVSPLLTLVHLTGRDRLTKAADIVNNLPQVHAALVEGRLNPYRATMIANGTCTLDADTRMLAAQILVDHGAGMCNTRLKSFIARTVRRLDRNAFEEMGIKARKERGFGMKVEDFGMARIWAVLPADQAVLINGIVEELADHNFALQRQNPDITFGSDLWRNRSQMRADVFADIVTTLATAGVVDLRPLLDGGPVTGSRQDPAKEGCDPEPSWQPDPDETAETVEAAEAVSTEEDGPAEATTPDAVVKTEQDAAAETTEATEQDAAAETTELDMAAETTELAMAAESTAADASEPETPEAPEPAKKSLAVEPQPAKPPPLIKQTGLNLTMSVETLLQIRNDPGYLDGFNFIPDFLRDGILKSIASVTVLVLDDCGTLLDLGKTARFPAKALARFIQTRDFICRFPGCNNSARRSDIDHQQPWKWPTGETAVVHEATTTKGQVSENAVVDSGSLSAPVPVPDSKPGPGRGPSPDGAPGCSSNHAAGETCAGNLAAGCRTHHLTKHQTRWEVEHCADHSLRWTTPNGHEHVTTPRDWRLTLPSQWIDEAEQRLRAKASADQLAIAEAIANLPDEPPF